MKKVLIPDSKKEKIKKALLDAVLSSTSHGLPNIFRSKSLFLKIIWIFCVLGFLSYCSLSIIRSINSYYNWEYVTKIDVIQEIPMEFPAVTICNLNIYATDYAQRLLNQILLQFWNISEINAINESYSYNEFLNIKYLFQMAAMSDNFTDENRRNFSLPLNDFLINCNFGLNKCSAKEFDWYYDMNYGNCFTFNNGRNFKGHTNTIRNSSQSGYFNGLRMELFLGNSSDVPLLIANSGVHVLIKNKSATPIPYEGIDVSSGELSEIIIGRSFEKKLDYPYSDCKFNLNSLDSFDSEIYREIIRSNKTYSKKICFLNCYQMEIIKVCQCYLPYFERFKSINKCDNTTEVLCGMSVTEYFYKQDVSKVCSPFCPQECEDVTYSLSFSHSNFPNPKYAEFLKKKLTNQYKLMDSNKSTSNSNFGDVHSVQISNHGLKKSIAGITIYYDDLKYTVISQIPKMNFEDLLANIGGQFGLFIGISFLSFVEIFDAIIQVIFILREPSIERLVFP